MAVTRITKRTVDTVHCPPGKRNVCLWDDTVKGFGLVITSNGVRTYVVQYRIGGRDAKTRRYTIGRHGSPWTPHTARERALDILQLVRTGVDPIDSERDARRMSDEDDEDRAYFDFDAFADRFIEKHVKANALRSLKDIQGTFDRDLRAWFRGKSVRRTGTRRRSTGSSGGIATSSGRYRRWRSTRGFWCCGRSSGSASSRSCRNSAPSPSRARRRGIG